MARGRKRKMSDKQEEYLLNMKGFVTTLRELQDVMVRACGLNVTLPTIRNYLINDLGEKGYKKLTKKWKKTRAGAL